MVNRKVEKKIKQNNGITLVALVVTIVVLLILAGITIMYVMGDNGGFSRASQAKIKAELGKIEERAQMIYSDKLLENKNSTLSIRVETSEVISKLTSEGYCIEKRPAPAEDITGISLDKEDMTIGTNKTAELKVMYEWVVDPFVYYVEVQGKYYKMHSNKGFITIDREKSTLSKGDFENGGEGTDSTLTVTSSDETVATVKLKDGSNDTIEVTAKAKGEETIITVGCGKYKKTCTVKVVIPILATNVTLNEKDYVVTGGDSWTNDLQLVATLKPSNVTEKEVTWTSSDPEIAIVDNKGLVKAGTKGGDVTITATTKDGTNKSATCKITTELFGAINASKTAYTDSDGNVVQIPDEFAVGKSDNVNKVTSGLVAQDNEGNQFVWIPVGNIKKAGTKAFDVTLGRYAFVENQAIPQTPVQTQANYSSAVNISGFYESGFAYDGFQESITQTGSNAYANAKLLKNFIDNAIIDGGYWIGRYEASGKTENRAQLKYNQSVWNNIKQTDASSKAKELKSSGIYQSDLVNSYALDTALVFIEKSGNTGYCNKKASNHSVLKSGRSGDKVCNIYDLCENCQEVTTEACSSGSNACALRGGHYNTSKNFTGLRTPRTNLTDSTTGNVSFRCLLYRI